MFGEGFAEPDVLGVGSPDYDDEVVAGGVVGVQQIGDDTVQA